MSKEAKKIDKKWLDADDIMIRRPSDDEQRLGKIQTSDFQISSLTIQTRIMSWLNLIDRVYRTKTTTIKKSNSNKIKKYKTIINKLFYNLKFINTTEEFYNVLTEDTNLSEKVGFDIKILLKSQKTWEKVLSQSHILPIVATFVKENNDSPYYTEEEVTRCKRNYIDVYEFLKKQSNRFENPSLYFSTLSNISSFKSIIKDEILYDAFDEIMDFAGSFEQLKDYIFYYLDTKNVGSIKKHTQSVINEMCLASQQKILNIIIENDIGDKLTYENYISYLEKFEPGLIENFEDKSGINIKNYSSFDDLCDTLYSPDIIHNIRDGLNVKIRARTSGDIRKGSELIIEQKRYISKYENAKRKFGEDINEYNPENENFNVNLKKKILDEKREDLESKKENLSNLKEQLSFARKNKNTSLVSLLKSKIRNIDEDIRQTNRMCKALKKDYIDTKNKVKAKNRVYEVYKQYKQKELEMIQNMKDERTEDDLHELDIIEQKLKNSLIKEEYIPYFTWRFVCCDMDTETANTICESLEKYLNEKNGVCGEPGYINATSHEFEEDGEILTQFFIDYPKSAAIYKAFEKKQNLSEILLKGFADCLGKNIKYIKEDTYFNVPMEKTLSQENNDTFWF